MTAPGTIQQALALGLHELSKEEIAALPHHLRAAGGLFASPCTAGGPGSYCTETPCDNGVKYLVYCDSSGGCTRYVKAAC